MNHARALASLILAMLLAVSAQAGPENPARALQDTSTRTFAIEINGVLCGYSEITPSRVRVDGRDAVLIDQNTFLMVSALGSEVNTEIHIRYHVDPSTAQFFRCASDITQGPTQITSEIQIRGDSALVRSSLSPGPKVTPLPADIVLETPITSPHLVRDFVGSDLLERVYNALDIRDGTVHRKRYVRVDSTRFEADGKEYGALVFDELDLASGIKARLWMDPSTGEGLRVEIAGGSRILTRSGRAVTKQIKTASLDENIFVKANVAIPNFKELTFMKVKATIEPMGLWVTRESLNVPGQRFEGRVEENLIEGVFEIRHVRYDGRAAPPFPPGDAYGEELRAYLEPGQFIESSDPVLAARAREITSGATDCWDAARRLSRWVADSINYAIPGGGTARKTYDTRSGECGAHSILLAAFCRSVGIPARVVWGCMYTPNRGGSFGQHGWSEIHMGESGWVTVDATADEIDFVDSGHLRLGELEYASVAFNAKSMEILDYRSGTLTMAQADAPSSDQYRPYLGTYALKEANLNLMVSEKGGQLSAEIPGKIVFGLQEPDEAGRWVSTVSDQLYCTFRLDGEGQAHAICLHELLRLPRVGAPDSVAPETPERFLPYLGTYRLPMRNADFRVWYKDKSLAVDDPLASKTIHLRLPDESGGWVDEYGKNTIYFERDEAGGVTALTIDAATTFPRAE